MKIIVCFNIESLEGININREDYVLGNVDLNTSRFNYININQCSIDYVKYKNDFELSIDDLFISQGLPNGIKNLFDSISPNFYIHNLRFCIFWIQSFLKLLENSVEEIVFTDFVPEANYFPYYEAEGEVNRALFYENFDFISSQLMRHAELYCIHNRYCSIRILNFRSLLVLKLRIFLRRYFLFLLKIVFHFCKIVITKKTKKISNESELIISTRSLAHSFGLEPLLKNTECTIHVCDGLSFSNKNKKYIKSIYRNFSSQYQTLSLSDLFNSIKSCYSFFSQRKSLDVTIEIYGARIYLKSIFIEACVSHLESLLYAKSVFNLCKNNEKIRVVINTELITPYSFWLKNICDTIEVKVIQLQTVVIDRFPSPNFVFSDLFLFDSKAIFSFFHTNQYINLAKMNFWGNLNYEVGDVKTNKRLNSIVYFTQPYEFENQNRILLFLIEYTKKNELNFYVKLHPRENLANVPKYILNKLFILPKDITEEEYLKYCDVAILRTSSMTQDLILRGIPVINFINTSYDRSVLNLYLNSEGINVCNDFEKLEFLLNDFINFQKDYSKYRIDYLNNLGINLGLNDFVLQLENFLKYK